MIGSQLIKVVVLWAFMMTPTFAENVLVIFTKPSVCPPCVALEHTMKTREVRAVLEESKIRVYRLDPIDNKHFKEYMDKLKLIGIPAIVIVDTNEIEKIRARIIYSGNSTLFASDLKNAIEKSKPKEQKE